MTVEKQSAVPICWYLNKVLGAVCQASGMRGNGSLRLCGTGNGEKKDGCHRQ